MDTLKIEKEVNEAFQCIKDNNNFILEGGAGSGKTYSLISLIKVVTSELPETKIACITYTNNAVAEILSRIENENLWVSTIHEFIWFLIKKYQNEIKEVLVELINDNNISIFKKPNNFNEDFISIDYFENLSVDYDDYYSITSNNDNKVKISHNHILIVAEKMFCRYKKLSDILKDTAKCIFVDEYQDTNPLVAEILLTHLSKSDKKNVIGFFGDSMQAIYDDGIGDLDEYGLTKIVKNQNRRNPRVIIEIANRFRNDAIKQIPSDDINAPNMENGIIREGCVKFLYGVDSKANENIKENEIFKFWDFSDGKRVKELRLTHKYNAEMAGFKNLFDLYNDDLIIKLIDKIKPKIVSSELDKQKTLNELALELNPIFKKENLLDLILVDGKYSFIYNDLKDLQWKDVYEKCRITKESLMSYKLNGMNGKYESKSSRDRILQRLDILNEIIELYDSKSFNEFLRKTKTSISCKKDKINLRDTIDYLTNDNVITIEKALSFSEDKGLLQHDDLFTKYILNKGFYLWERIKKISFKEYQASILYLKEFSPICTQHSVKGSEYDNVLLILESNWNKYDFKTLFGKGSSSKNVQERTRKLFYVCITRAKKNLVIYMPIDDSEIINMAKNFFGQKNVINISSIE